MVELGANYTHSGTGSAFGPESSLAFLAANLYTIVVPSVILTIFVYHQAKGRSKDLGYPSAGYRGWWEPMFLVRLRFVLGAVGILREGYYKFKDQAFWVRRNDVDILVLPVRFLDEIRNYTREQLSGIEALAFNVLGKFTGIDIFVKSDLHVRVIRNYLTANMGKVMLNARDELNYSWQVDVPKCEDWEEVDIQHVMKWIIARISARTFIGYPACRNNAWVQTSLDYSHDIFTLAFFMHWFPEFLHPILLPLTPARWRLDRHTKYVHEVLAPAVKQWEDAVAGGIEKGEPFTLLTGMLKDAKGSERDMKEIVVRQLISSLASIHTSVMTATFCLLELCKHPEYFEELTEEAQQCMAEDPDWARDSTTRLPKLDSFLCEVHRLNPPSTLLPQRRAREAITLSNGIHVPVGTHFAFPLGPVTHDPKVFPNPDEFDGFRYYRRRVQEGSIGQTSKYMAATPSEEHLTFGHGTQACPGRFFAVNEVKLILVYFLVDYEFKQPERQKSSRLHLPFEEYFVLNPMLKLMMRRKQDLR